MLKPKSRSGSPKENRESELLGVKDIGSDLAKNKQVGIFNFLDKVPVANLNKCCGDFCKHLLNVF